MTGVQTCALPILYTLTATRGGLTLNTAGLGLFNVSTGAALTGTLTGASISFQADLTKGNAALPLVLFRPNVNANGIGFSVKLDVNDQGNTGNPLSALSGTASTSFSVSAVNDRAFPTISTTVTPVLEDTPTKLANIFANLSVADPDAGAAKLLVALSVDQGQLEFDTTGKSLFDSSTGALLSGVISGSTVQFKATVSATNAALPQFVFSPPLNANGTGFNLTLSVDDLGNTGASTGTGPNLVTRNFSVTPVNDFPFVQSALSLTSNAGVKEILSQGGLLTRDVESTAKDLIYPISSS